MLCGALVQTPRHNPSRKLAIARDRDKFPIYDFIEMNSFARQVSAGDPENALEIVQSATSSLRRAVTIRSTLNPILRLWVPLLVRATRLGCFSGVLKHHETSSKEWNSIDLKSIPRDFPMPY